MKKLTDEEIRRRKEVGKTLKMLRNACGISQASLGEILYMSRENQRGTKRIVKNKEVAWRSYISRIESGEIAINPEDAQILAEFFMSEIAEQNLYEKEELKPYVSSPLFFAEDGNCVNGYQLIIDWKYFTCEKEELNSHIEDARRVTKAQEFIRVTLPLLKFLGYSILDEKGDELTDEKVIASYLGNSISCIEEERFYDYGFENIYSLGNLAGVLYYKIEHDGKRVLVSPNELKRLFSDIMQYLDLKMEQEMHRNRPCSRERKTIGGDKMARTNQGVFKKFQNWNDGLIAKFESIKAKYSEDVDRGFFDGLAQISEDLYNDMDSFCSELLGILKATKFEDNTNNEKKYNEMLQQMVGNQSELKNRFNDYVDQIKRGGGLEENEVETIEDYRIWER